MSLTHGNIVELKAVSTYYIHHLLRKLNVFRYLHSVSTVVSLPLVFATFSAFSNVSKGTV